MTTRMMATHVEAFLAERRVLGFRTNGPSASQLRSFARFFDGTDRKGSLTTELVVEWAKEHARTDGPRAWARRLDALRPFATYLLREDPATEFPQTQIFGKSQRRATPHIYTEEEVLALLAAARHLEPVGGLRPAAYEAFYGLIAATGLRISEAIKLRCADVDLGSRCLTVRMTKFSKSRHVPFHSTTASALADYLAVRDRFLPRAAEQSFFVSTPERSLKSRAAHWTFQRLRSKAGIVARGAYPEVRIHDFRHTFICRRIQRWRADGADIDNAIAALSTYVGHAKISDTYWYLTGIPDLMAAAGNRFEDFAFGEKGNG
ncbi:Site-specific recombinase XerD [Novosphingobium lubricantis]|nr:MULTISPECIES: tyrosine-type recombinase/integrase [Sphingomonadaceae]CAH0356862.1 Tyrosine recombinase XerC [Sphingobium sp. CECT 9361]CAH0498539.1 Tyrosine recombinase XerC [Novosphingobium sp. CECT 9465]